MSLMSLNQLATYLNARLTKKGWSGRTLALYAELSQTAIARALKGKTVPDPESLRKIAVALEVEELHLLRLAGHVESPASEDLDPAAAYIARRITQLPPAVRERAIDAVGSVLDTITELVAADERKESSQPAGKE